MKIMLTIVVLVSLGAVLIPPHVVSLASSEPEATGLRGFVCDEKGNAVRNATVSIDLFIRSHVGEDGEFFVRQSELAPCDPTLLVLVEGESEGRRLACARCLSEPITS